MGSDAARSFRSGRQRARRERRRLERQQAKEIAEAEKTGGQEAVEKLRAEHQRLAQEAEKKRDADRNKARSRFGEFEAIREKFGGDVRYAMRRETELTFDYVIRNDRDLVELIDADYTFLNERLAEYYGIPGVEGNEMRRVELPEDSPRGGVLTQGTTLVVTSNPTRTSPVKRGLFVLDNILGTPAPPPPNAVPPLEAAAGTVADHEPSLREALDIHRKDPLCAGCHARMDPLGPRARKLQRHRHVARHRARPPHRHRRHALDRRIVPNHPRPQAGAQKRAPRSIFTAASPKSCLPTPPGGV